MQYVIYHYFIITELRNDVKERITEFSGKLDILVNHLTTGHQFRHTPQTVCVFQYALFPH